MEYLEYKSIKLKLIKIAIEVYSLKALEKKSDKSISITYEWISKAIESLNELGVKLGYIHPVTGNLIDKPIKDDKNEAV